MSTPAGDEQPHRGSTQCHDCVGYKLRLGDPSHGVAIGGEYGAAGCVSWLPQRNRNCNRNPQLVHTQRSPNRAHSSVALGTARATPAQPTPPHPQPPHCTAPHCTAPHSIAVRRAPSPAASRSWAAPRSRRTGGCPCAQRGRREGGRQSRGLQSGSREGGEGGGGMHRYGGRDKGVCASDQGAERQDGPSWCAEAEEEGSSTGWQAGEGQSGAT